MYDNPYGILHIYYLSGRLAPEPEDFGGAYLGNWEEDDTSFLFFSRPAPESVDALLAAQPHLSLIDTFQMSYDQWQGGAIEAQAIAGVVLQPPWVDPPPTSAPDAVVLKLDPGLVFGNGTHPTTADCIRALKAAFSRKPAPETILDLGTGTGVLALAAAGLGGRRILAVDLNPLATRTAHRNVAINELSDRVLVVRGRAETFIETSADLLVANIHFAVLQEVMASTGFDRKRQVVLSGLLRSEARTVENELLRRDFRIRQVWRRNGTWCTIHATSGAKPPL